MTSQACEVVPEMEQRPSTLKALAGSMRRSPVMTMRAALIGLSAAARAPLWASGVRLKSALEAQVDSSASQPGMDDALDLSLRVANGAVRHLSRTGTAWRNTCLYRSMAQYLVLRGFGRDAAVRIGVRGPGHETEDDVSAHSWVLYRGPEEVQGGGSYYEEMRFRR
jgi:hypothetical protein